MHDIKVVMTHEEAIELFHKTNDNFATDRYTGTDETGETETEVEWVYDWMGNGRTSWGVDWSDLSDRMAKLLHKLLAQYGPNKYGPKGTLIFSSRKEVYPAVFHIILY